MGEISKTLMTIESFGSIHNSWQMVFEIYSFLRTLKIVFKITSAMLFVTDDTRQFTIFIQNMKKLAKLLKLL